MKVIDLAKKQINDEMLPKHIRYENEDLYFDGVTYYDKEGNNDFFDIFAMNNSALTHLYDEVEIIEEVEDKEYEDIEEVKEIELYKTYQDYLENNFTINMANIISDIEAIFNENNDKINALIKNQKKIINEIKNKD